MSTTVYSNARAFTRRCYAPEVTASISDWARGFLVILVLAGYPFVAALGQLLNLDELSLPSVVFRLIVAALAIALLFWKGIQSKKNQGVFFLAWFGFWFSYLIRVIYDSFVISSTNLPLSGNEYLIYIFVFCIFPTLGVLHRFPTAFSRKLLSMTIGWASFVLLFIIYAAYSYGMIETDIFASRLELKRLNPISIGMLSGSILLLTIFRWLNYRSPLAVMNVVSIGIMVVAVGALAFSGSKGPILATIVSLLVYSILPFKLNKFILILIISVLMGSFFLWLLKSSTENSDFALIIRILDFVSGENKDMSTIYRLEGYEAAWNQFLDSPIVGDSLVESSLNFYPHNLFLEIAISTGIIGLIFFMIIISLTLSRSFSALSSNSSFCWIDLLFIQYFVAAMFSGGLYMASEMWVFLTASFFIHQPAYTK